MVATALRTSPRSTEPDDDAFDYDDEIDQVFCPSCSTNLVMIDHSKNINSTVSSPKGTATIAEVPFCFGCKAHVVCNAEQVQTLIQLGASGHTRIAHKGAILVATPSNIKLKQQSGKAWADSRLREEHELMIEYFQAATMTEGEEVEMALIPEDDNLYLTITPSNVGKQTAESDTDPQSPLRFLTEQPISAPEPVLFFPPNDDRLDDDDDTYEQEEEYDEEQDEARGPNDIVNGMDIEPMDIVNGMDILGSHTEDDGDIDQLFGSKEVVEEPKAVETIELIHCERKTLSNDKYCESSSAKANVQVQMVTATENIRAISPPTLSDESQSEASISEIGDEECDLPEYNVR